MTAPLERLVAQALPGGTTTWFQELLAAVMAGGPGPARAERLRALRAALDAHPMRDALLARLRDRWNDPSMVRFLAETGIPAQTSLTRELLHRASRTLLPRLRDEHDVGETLFDLRPTAEDAAWLEALPAEALDAWRDVAPSRAVLLRAAHLVAVRAAAAGLSPFVLQLAGNPAVGESPFLALPAVIAAAEGEGPAAAAWEPTLAAARRAHDRLEGMLEERGVSTEAVFQLELLAALLARLGDLMVLATRGARADARPFAAGLLRAVGRQHRLREVVRTASKRLARRIVEATGRTGEHYTVRTRAEWTAQLDGSIAAGFLTTLTALGKYAIGALALAPVLAGVAYWANYSLSFCLMQVNHWALASKQPAMTASALAAALDDQDQGYDDEIELIAGITRSQLVVTLGNAVATVALALLLDLLFGLFTRHRILSVAKASSALQAIHPVTSWTALFATTTGISLWLSSLAAGWAANWSTFRALPEATRRDERVRRLLGRGGAARAGDFVEEHFGGIAGYVMLGFLLGFVPVFLQSFVGIGLEVRHITLQAASVAFAWLPLWDVGLLGWREVAWSVAGIALTGVLNFTVSFSLALRTAFRARDYRTGQRAAVLRGVRAAFRAHPGRFLWRPRAP
jgi:site-specific recombinase